MRYIRSSETVISEMAVSEMANERISDETFHRTFYHAVHCGSQEFFCGNKSVAAICCFFRHNP